MTKRQTDCQSGSTTNKALSKAPDRAIQRIRLIRVLLAGASAPEVAKQLGLGRDHCRDLLKEIEQETNLMNMEEFKSLLWSRVQGILLDHKTMAGSLEMLLYQVDKDLDRLQPAYDRLKAAIDAPSGTITSEERTTAKAEHPATMAALIALRAEKVTLQREKRANSKDFVDVISKMGVTTSPSPDMNRVPTHPSTNNNFEKSSVYSGLSDEKVLEQLERSVSDMRSYLTSQKRLMTAKEVNVQEVD